MAKQKPGESAVTAPPDPIEPTPSAPIETKALPPPESPLQLSFTDPRSHSEAYTTFTTPPSHVVPLLEYTIWAPAQTTSSPIEPAIEIIPSIIESAEEKSPKRNPMGFFHSSEDAERNGQSPVSATRISDSLPQFQQESEPLCAGINHSAPASTYTNTLAHRSPYKIWTVSHTVPPMNTDLPSELPHTGDYVTDFPLENGSLEKEAIRSIELDYTPSFTTKVGEGAFSIVYKDIYKNQKVAIKIPIQDWLQAIFHIRNEHFILEKIQQQHTGCPNIVSMYAFDSTHAWLIVEWMEKGSLDKLLSIQPQPVLAINLSHQLMTDILQGTAFLHQHHILHRDLKPANILLSHQYQAKLADFGIAIDLSQNFDFTARGGPIAWMPPEVLSAILYQLPFKPELSNDVYNIAIILLMIICWRSEPYQTTQNIRNSYQAILDHALLEDIRTGKRDEMPHTTPFWLKERVCQSLDKEPQNRPSAKQLLQTILCHKDNPITQSSSAHESATTFSNIRNNY